MSYIALIVCTVQKNLTKPNLVGLVALEGKKSPLCTVSRLEPVHNTVLAKLKFSKIFEFSNQCLVLLRSWKSVSNSRNLLDGSKQLLIHQVGQACNFWSFRFWLHWQSLFFCYPLKIKFMHFDIQFKRSN